jgi:hypothetical protein
LIVPQFERVWLADAAQLLMKRSQVVRRPSRPFISSISSGCAKTRSDSLEIVQRLTL